MVGEMPPRLQVMPKPKGGRRLSNASMRREARFICSSGIVSVLLLNPIGCSVLHKKHKIILTKYANSLFFAVGRQSHTSFHPTTNHIVAPSSIPMAGKTKTINMEESEPETPHALTIEEIKSTIQDYVNAAKQCKAAGFDGVEIHAAN